MPDTPSAFQPFPLTDQGIRQSSELAKVIIEYSQQFDCEINNIIASSRLLRSWQTAKTMADTLDDHQLMVQEYPQLAERCVGSVANFSAKQISEIITKDPRFKRYLIIGSLIASFVCHSRGQSPCSMQGLELRH